MSRSPNVIVPVLVVRLTPVPPEPVTDVLAKLNVRLDVLTLIPAPVGFVTVVEPVLKLPPTLVRLRPVVALFVEERLPNVPLRVPVVRFKVLPLPFNVTSETLSVPKVEPVISDVALPPVKPRSVLFWATVMPMPALVMLTIGAPGFVVGNGSLPVAGVMPEIVERVCVASCPMNF